MPPNTVRMSNSRNFRSHSDLHRRLYRRLLRAHRFLPYEMRSLGDDYIKAGYSLGYLKTLFLT